MSKYHYLEHRFSVSVSDWLDIGDEQVENESSWDCDHDLAEEHDDWADTSHDSESERVGPGEFEPVFGSIAEVLSSDGDRDVSLGVDELDDALHTGQTALNALQNVLHALGVLSLGLSLEKLDHQLEELHDSQDKRPESKTSPVVTE